MKSLLGTQTLDNLIKAFAGESQARNRYTFYSAVAENEGYIQMKDIFNETADNEKEHAERFFNFMVEGLKGKMPIPLKVEADYPVAKSTTLENLLAAADGEHEEHSLLYPEFSKIAKEEGFLEIAKAFDAIATVEKHHEKRYRKLAENIKDESVFKKSAKVSWKCLNCGYVHEGTTAVETCPSCLHPQSYFEVFTEKF